MPSGLCCEGLHQYQLSVSISFMPARSSTPRDANQIAKSIVDQATGAAPKAGAPPAKNAAAVALGKLGGKKGGAARAAVLTPEQRSEIAKKAAAWRWKKA